MLTKFNIFRYHKVINVLTRNYLSEAYKCTEAWKTRLTAPFMQNANLDQLYYNLDQRFQQSGQISAIDVDIFANKVEGNTHIDEMADLVYKLRQTQEASSALESTGHAIIRNLVETDHTEELLQILNNRLGYGVFLDYYIASFALDKFIKDKDYKTAAQIASLLMLQEDFSNELNKFLSLYACFNYAKNPEILPPQTQTNESDQEEIKVRVKFLRNTYFDEHFDLKDHNQLIGKTMDMISDMLEDEMQKNFKLLGLTLYKKFPEAELIIDSHKSLITKEFVVLCQNILNKYEEHDKENEQLVNYKRKLEELLARPLKDSNYEDKLKSLVETTVQKNEKNEIEKQNNLYQAWSQERETALKTELERLQRVQRLQQVEDLTKQMEAEEQKLWFFENQDQIDLKIDSKKVYYPKRWFGKKKKPKVVDEDYVPPEVRSQR